MTMLVRLKPYAPRRGHVLRRYTYKSIKFQAERGWYRVEEEVAEYLREIHQIPSDEHSPHAFEVCTEKEAKALEAEREAEANRGKRAADAVDTTTEDRPKAKRSSAGKRSKG